MIEEIKERPLYCLVAPDGTPQFTIIGEDILMCMAFINLLATYGISEPIVELLKRGYTIEPVTLTLKNRKINAPSTPAKN